MLQQGGKNCSIGVIPTPAPRDPKNGLELRDHHGATSGGVPKGIVSLFLSLGSDNSPAMEMMIKEGW